MKRSQVDWIAALDWNIQDAREALQCAFAMNDYRGVRKYAAQLEALNDRRARAESIGPRRRSRELRRSDAWAVRLREGGGFRPLNAGALP